MDAKPSFPRPSSLSITVAAAFATFIAIGLLTTVAFLFKHDGVPTGKLVVAEHTCARNAYVSEREACMREWLAARASNVASK